MRERAREGTYVQNRKPKAHAHMRGLVISDVYALFVPSKGRWDYNPGATRAAQKPTTDDDEMVRRLCRHVRKTTLRNVRGRIVR